MSASNLAVSAVVVVCFYGLWWGLSLSRRLGRLERHSKLDPLTGLGSGDWLYNERWPAALRSGRPLGVIFLDLDGLKLRNDSLGHGVGDEYIRTAADTICKAVRRGVDEVFRTNKAGDEFEVLIHGRLADPSRVAWSLLQRLADRGVSASLGLAYTTATDFIPDRANLRLAAEEACRAAKKQGGGCGVVAGHGLVTAPASDMTDSGHGPHLNSWATSGASVQSTDAIPLEISEGVATTALTPAAQALLAAESGGSPDAAEDHAKQARTVGERIRCKREAAGWTRRQLSEASNESAETIKHVERALQLVAPTTLAKLEACLDAELARQGLTGKKP
jgi:diguanylate cyclase (GGDEF)-like protein